MVQVDGRAAGSTTVTAYAADGSTASCTVTVEAPYIPPVVVEPLTLNQTSIVLTQGDWFELKAISGTCVDWNTTNPNVIRLFDVNQPNQINLKAESAGTAEVIAYGPDDTTTVCRITVNPFIAPEPEYIPEPEPVYTPEPEPVYTPEPEIPFYDVPAVEIYEDSDAGENIAG